MARQGFVALVALLLSVTLTEAVSTRQLQSVNAISQLSISYNRSITGSDPLGKLPFNDTRLADTSGGLDPSQVHLTYNGGTNVTVSWATGQGIVTASPVPGYAADQAGPGNLVSYGTMPGMYTTNVTSTTITSYTQTYNFTNANPILNYSSPLFHHVVLQDLTPNTKYYYICGDPRLGMSNEFNFTSPPALGEDSYPMVLGVVADTGLTPNTTVTIQHLVDSKPQVWTLIGDFSYADDMQTNGTTTVSNGTFFSYVPSPAGTYQPWWDMWYRYMQNAILSSIPLIPNHGNHELEPQFNATYGVGLNGSHQFQSYIARNPVSILANASGSDSPLWYSVNMGPAHMVYLSNYADFHVGSDQYNWLVNDLATFNRKTTPWLLATFHAPFYSSYTTHYLENECMREAMETLLYENGVDVILNGHLHEYERTNPVYNFTVDQCGPVHITMGDGGNIEGVYKTFADQPGHCPLANMTVPKYQPGGFCPILPYDGQLCASSQPAWSAFREPTYGHGTLTFMNETTAFWRWNRNLDNEAVVGDSVYIIREMTCQNKASYAASAPATANVTATAG